LQNPSWYHFALFPFLFVDILLYKSKSVTDVFDQLFKDEELKLILNTNVQYYNDSPDTLSFLLHVVAQRSYFKGGGYFIKGGSGRLSDYLADVVRQNGGEIITSAQVIGCFSNEVEYEHKRKRHLLKSDEVISNLSPQQTYALYDFPYVEKKLLGNSLLTIYLGFSQNLKETYGERAYSNFIFDEMVSVKNFNEMIKKDILEKAFVFVDYSQLDSNLTKDKSKSFGAICMMDNIEDWNALSAEEYKEKKEKLIEITVNKLEKYYPNISNLVEYAEVGTAKTVQRYIKTPNGTAYGFKPTPKEFFRISEVKSKKVKNLYFVGQWVIAGGFSPSIVSGALCADRF
jgi:phytoene dehydrogenase-like protein